MDVVETNNAPDPAGAYSQGIIDDGRVYISGQVGYEPEMDEVISDDIAEQTTQALKNIEAVLEAADTSLDNAIKATVYLTDIDAFDEVNEAYADYLNEPYPARAVIEVSDLVSPFRVEIEMIAALN